MLNEQKIKKMRKLAAYESGKGREDLSISNYYRSDYIGLALIKNFLSRRSPMHCCWLSTLGIRANI